MKIVIDGSKMTTSELVHQWLAARLNLPVWYGRNMDALYDMLVGQKAPLTIELVNWDELGLWGQAFLKTVKDATAANENITCLHK